MTAPAGTPLAPYERASFLLFGLALLVTFLLHLVPGFLAGFLSWALLAALARRLHGRRISHGVARMLAVGSLGLVAAGAVTAAVILLYGFLRGRIGDLPSVVEKMSETTGRLREMLASSGLPVPPATGSSGEAAAKWLKEHAEGLRHAGTVGLRGLAHALLGAFIGIFVFFREPDRPAGPLATALGERVRSFADAFRSVAKAQIEISVVNTLLTALFLFGAEPLFGVRLPLPGTLVAIAFLCGLIPVAGNLVSNTVIVLVSLGVSPWAGVAALGFLLVVHKLEYFLNAKIVGGRIGAAAWETLLAIVVFEAAFGIPGVILAPVIYAWAKGELSARGLV
ncbi:MAG TPA: AI-2E family transporter [Thermoanaerobaculia bacterium]|nr:AI-2E family transporter [Thermoanaerobaculia bacterium]